MNDGELGPVVLDIESTFLSEREHLLLENPYVGGVILFRRNFISPAQVETLIQNIRSIRPNIVIAVDQEGGRVQRFIEGFTRLPSLQALANTYLDERSLYYHNNYIIRESAWLMASELLTVGVDISFAPVVDADSHFSQVIGDRSFSKDIQLVSQFGQWYMEGMHEAGMATTLKHFPGHGAVQADSHKSLPEDERTFDQVVANDMVPFIKLLPYSDAVMPAHIRYSNIDTFPVGFSQFWLRKILRGQLDYQGVIFSDDLTMEGAAIAGSYSERAVAALSAGCDAVLICNNPEGAVEVLNFLQCENWPLGSKLALMKSKPTSTKIAFSDLKSSHRWLNITNAIKSL